MKTEIIRYNDGTYIAKVMVDNNEYHLLNINVYPHFRIYSDWYTQKHDRFSSIEECQEKINLRNEKIKIGRITNEFDPTVT